MPKIISLVAKEIIKLSKLVSQNANSSKRSKRWKQQKTESSKKFKNTDMPNGNNNNQIKTEIKETSRT